MHLTPHWQWHQETSDIAHCAWLLLPCTPQRLCGVPNTNSQPLPVPPPAMQHPVDPNCSSGSFFPLSQGTMPDISSLLVDSPSSATYSLGLVATTALPQQGVRDIQRHAVQALHESQRKELDKLTADDEKASARIFSATDKTAAPWLRLVPDRAALRFASLLKTH